MTETFLPPSANIKLVVSDMDGTLLDSNSELPPKFWDLLQQMEEEGIVFVPASGRQYASLARIFPTEELGFIAENGNFVVYKDDEVFAAALDPEVVSEVLDVFDVLKKERNAGLVLCNKYKAYVERDDQPFLDEVGKYYANLEVVPDLQEVKHKQFAKVAMFDFDTSDALYPPFEKFGEDNQVVLSGPFWMDIQKVGVDKGTGLAALQEKLGVTPDETAVFADYHNDLPMFRESTYGFAVENGHEDVKEASYMVIPSNDDHGVLQVVEEILQKVDA